MSLRDLTHGRSTLKGSARTAGWYPLGRVLQPPRDVRAWLLERGSLTKRLQNHYGAISVRVLQQQVGKSYVDEGLRSAAPVIVRNVVLASGNQNPLVVAHSILPLRPRGALSLMLKRLGRQALGSLLFTRPGFMRYQREWALLDQRDPLWGMTHSAIGGLGAQPLWARRAVFSPLKFRSQAVQVTEVFCLPASK